MRVNSVAFCIILASSGKLVEGFMLFYSIKLTFYSLYSSSGKASSCCLFPSLTNFIDLGQGQTVQLIVLNRLEPQDLLVFTIIIQDKKNGFLLKKKKNYDIKNYLNII